MALPQTLQPQQEEKKRITWEEYLQLPSSMERMEIEDGEVVLLAGSSAKHQRVLTNLLLLLGNDPQMRGSGAILPAPFDVVITQAPLRVRQPDLVYIRYEKVGGSVEALDALARLEVAPDLVVEILSPNDTIENLNAKLQDYHTLGVPEVWLVDLVPNHVFVLLREEEGWKWQEPVKGEQPLPTRQLAHSRITPKAIFEG